MNKPYRFADYLIVSSEFINNLIYGCKLPFCQLQPINKILMGLPKSMGANLKSVSKSLVTIDRWPFKEAISLDNSLEILRANQDAILNFPLLWTGILILFKIFWPFNRQLNLWTHCKDLCPLCNDRRLNWDELRDKMRNSKQFYTSQFTASAGCENVK